MCPSPCDMIPDMLPDPWTSLYPNKCAVKKYSVSRAVKDMDWLVDRQAFMNWT
jgi:hypothetical protein